MLGAEVCHPHAFDPRKNAHPQEARRSLGRVEMSSFSRASLLLGVVLGIASPACSSGSDSPSSASIAHPCVDPTAVLIAGSDTGFDTCANGVLRRRAVLPCPGSSGCTGDASCVAGQICVCGASGGTCQAASCTSDAACENGSSCAQYVPSPETCTSPTGFACQTPQDQCLAEADCANTHYPDDGLSTPFCLFLDGARVCAAGACAP